MKEKMREIQNSRGVKTKIRDGQKEDSEKNKESEDSHKEKAAFIASSTGKRNKTKFYVKDAGKEIVKKLETL